MRSFTETVGAVWDVDMLDMGVSGDVGIMRYSEVVEVKVNLEPGAMVQTVFLQQKR
jgi:hypothetical protein